MKEQKSQHKIFKADPAKVETYLLLGDDYDFNEDPLDAEELARRLREGRMGKDEQKDNETKRTYSRKER